MMILTGLPVLLLGSTAIGGCHAAAIGGFEGRQRQQRQQRQQQHVHHHRRVEEEDEYDSTSSTSSSGEKFVPLAPPPQRDYVGLQSGPDPAGGSSFASSAAYNPADHTVVIAGSAYGNYFDSGSHAAEDDHAWRANDDTDFAGCFVATVQLPSATAAAANTDDNSNSIEWVSYDKYHTTAVPEACIAAVIHHHDEEETAKERVLVAGHSQEDGLLEPIRASKTPTPTNSQQEQFGILLDLQYTAAAADAGNNTKKVLEYVAGYLLQQQQEEEDDDNDDEDGHGGSTTTIVASSPVGMTHPDNVHHATYVVSTELRQKGAVLAPYVAAAASAEAAHSRPDHPDPAAVNRYGKANSFTVQKIQLDRDQEEGDDAVQHVGEHHHDLAGGWHKNYITPHEESIEVAGILHIPAHNILVVAGSTAASAVTANSNINGNAFGKKKWEESHDVSSSEGDDVESSAVAGDDMDGFLTRLNPNNGQLQKNARHPMSDPAVRIESTDARDDFIRGLCYDETADPDHFFVVGTTAGNINATSQEQLAAAAAGYQAFVTKIDAAAYHPVWTVQLSAAELLRMTGYSAETDDDGTSSATAMVNVVQGLACAVTPDGASVYMAGTIGPAGPVGGTDLFVAQLGAGTAALEFVTVQGTAADDRLAARGGLVVDQEGNAIVVANTAGSFYRQRTTATATATTHDDGDGSDDVLLLSSSSSSLSMASDVVIFTIPRTVLPPQSSSEGLQPKSGGGGSSSSVMGITILVLFITALLSVLMVGLLLYRLKRSSTTDKNSMTAFHYMTEFDGEHGSYAGDLGKRSKNKKLRPPSTRSLTTTATTTSSSSSSDSEGVTVTNATAAAAAADAAASQQPQNNPKRTTRHVPPPFQRLSTAEDTAIVFMKGSSSNDNNNNNGHDDGNGKAGESISSSAAKDDSTPLMGNDNHSDSDDNNDDDEEFYRELPPRTKSNDSVPPPTVWGEDIL